MYSMDTSSLSDSPSMVQLDKTAELIRMNLATRTDEPSDRTSQSTESVSDTDVVLNEPITKSITKEHISNAPCQLPDKQLSWCTISLQDAVHLSELYELLSANYVEDVESMFRLDYSPEFLRWSLMQPGWLPQWHVGVRNKMNGRLVGFIAAVPVSIRVYDRSVRMAEVNFLCVHKKWRSMRLTPALFGELSRRCHREGVFQAVCTTGVLLPDPVGVCNYWYRLINTRKLIEVGYCPLPRHMTMEQAIQRYALSGGQPIAGFREFDPIADGEQAFALVTNYLKKFDLAPEFTLDSFLHLFSPREGVLETYVVADPSGWVKDFVSFYSLRALVLGHSTHKDLRIAYAFYCVARSVTLSDLIYEAIMVANKHGHDAFAALDLMDNKEFLKSLKFELADEKLNYYLYNWRCPSMDSQAIGLILR